MARLYLVRHGQASASWDHGTDPGLSELGQAQSKAVAERLSGLGPLPLVVSPLLRTRETAVPLQARWQVEPQFEAAVKEIPSPSELDPEARGPWLRSLLFGTWAEADPRLQPWRRGIVDCLLALHRDTVVVSHFVVINVAVGHARRAEQVMVFRPDNCSVTILETDGRDLHLIELGQEAVTQVR